MIGWTHERSEERDNNVGNLGELIHCLINATFAAVTIIAGVLALCGGIFATQANGMTRWGAIGIGLLTIVAGGLMGRRE
jgi:uncharacterized membrane protein HdeD (DUF308 family)